MPETAKTPKAAPWTPGRHALRSRCSLRSLDSSFELSHITVWKSWQVCITHTHRECCLENNDSDCHWWNVLWDKGLLETSESLIQDIKGSKQI